MEKSLAPAGNRTLAVQPVPIPTELSRLPQNLLYTQNKHDDKWERVTGSQKGKGKVVPVLD
jgi:hypothetical protein